MTTNNAHFIKGHELPSSAEQDILECRDARKQLCDARFPCRLDSSGVRKRGEGQFSRHIISLHIKRVWLSWQQVDKLSPLHPAPNHEGSWQPGERDEKEKELN